MPVSHSEHLRRIFLKTVEQRERIVRQREEIEARRAELWARMDQLRALGSRLSRPSDDAWPVHGGDGEPGSCAAVLFAARSADCTRMAEHPSCLVPSLFPGD
jgi:hypothetical protein